MYAVDRARTAVLDMLGAMIAQKFDVPIEAARSPLAILSGEDVRVVGLRLMEAASMAELFAWGSDPRP